MNHGRVMVLRKSTGTLAPLTSTLPRSVAPIAEGAGRIPIQREALCRLLQNGQAPCCRSSAILDMSGVSNVVAEGDRGVLIRLPRRQDREQRPSSNGLRNRQAPLVAHATEPIPWALGDLRPLRLSGLESGFRQTCSCVNCLLHACYLYLGHRNTVRREPPAI